MAAKTIASLITVLIQVESGGDDRAVGDKHLKQKAYGCLQIRQPVCDDYNDHHGTAYRAEQMRGNRELSVKVCRWYLEYYGARLGRAATEQDCARIWNGGPNGWKRQSTRGYWKKVQENRKEGRDAEKDRDQKEKAAKKTGKKGKASG